MTWIANNSNGDRHVCADRLDFLSKKKNKKIFSDVFYTGLSFLFLRNIGI